MFFLETISLPLRRSGRRLGSLRIGTADEVPRTEAAHMESVDRDENGAMADRRLDLMLSM